MPSLCVECNEQFAAKDDYKCLQCRDAEEGREYPLIKDLLGQEIKPGDYVVWPYTSGSSAEMDCGQVVKIYYATGSDRRRNPIKAQLQPIKHRWRYQTEPKKVTITKVENLVKVPKPKSNEDSDQTK